MPQRTAHVVIADSDPRTRHTLSQPLRDAGFFVRTERSGAAVLAACSLRRPDVLVLGDQLPDMDALEICTHLRHDLVDPPTIVVTLDQPLDNMTSGYAHQMIDFAGGDYFLAKPCDGHLLVRFIEELMHEDGPTREVTTQASFPTRVVWPTRRRPAAPIGDHHEA